MVSPTSLKAFALTFCLAIWANTVYAKSVPARPALRGVTVCIDPGHPSETSAGTETNDRKLTERHVNWVVAQKLGSLLKSDGAQVVFTKNTEKQLVTNRRRAEIANAAHADLFLRLHCDYAGDDGFATFYPDHVGHSQGKTGPSTQIMTVSHRDASLFHRAAIVYLANRLHDRGVRGESRTSVGAKQGALTGSVFSEVPALTIEMCVLNKPRDVRFIRSNDGVEVLAKALEAGVSAVFIPHSTNE